MYCHVLLEYGQKANNVISYTWSSPAVTDIALFSFVVPVWIHFCIQKCVNLSWNGFNKIQCQLYSLIIKQSPILYNSVWLSHFCIFCLIKQFILSHLILCNVMLCYVISSHLSLISSYLMLSHLSSSYLIRGTLSSGEQEGHLH